MSPQRFDYLEMHYNNCIVWLYKYVFIKNTFPWNYIMAGYCIKENPQLLQPLVFVHYAQKLLLSAEERLSPFRCELCTISKTEVCSHQFIFIIWYFYGFSTIKYPHKIRVFLTYWSYIWLYIYIYIYNPVYSL